ncbi:MAG: hypothetical protein PHW13_10645 [Methylococcales bacterium]|nr:hypothetical protein [Methylococcales bacterium]
MKNQACIVLLAAGSFLLSGCVSQYAELNAYVPGIGEIMGQQIAMRHIKLWYAGMAQNWALAEYEIKELEEGFDEVGERHPTLERITERVPVLIAGNIQKPLEDLERAVNAHDLTQFAQDYQALTKGCNTCHRAAGFKMNRIKQPDFNPYSNQDFQIEN